VDPRSRRWLPAIRACRLQAVDRSGAARASRDLNQLLGILDYEDSSSGIYRAAFVVDNRLVACVFLASRPQLPSREWLATLLMKKRLDDSDRRALLAGRPLAAGADTGPLVCSCFRVGRNTIADAIRCHGLQTPAQVGAHLKAGTNCGSCLPEIGALIASTAAS
jgi:assimilatory nitrate reductase catalytic subunit